MPPLNPKTTIRSSSFDFQGGQGRQYRMKNPDQHNEVELNFIDKGEIILQHGVKNIRVTAGDMVIYWAAIPHQVIFAKPQTQIAWLVLPLSWFLSWELRVPFTNRILNGEVLFLPRNAAQPHAKYMTQWTRDVGHKTAEIENILELEIEAYFRRLAYGHIKSPPVLKASSSPIPYNQYGHVQQMVRFITNHFQDAITVTQIAMAAGLNAEYAMRLFRKCWGMTIWDFLLQQRIFRAQRLLLGREAKIGDIAFACGFGSASRFYHAFRKQCHCTPSAYRRRLAEHA